MSKQRQSSMREHIANKLSSINPTSVVRMAMAIADRAFLGAVTFLTTIFLGRSGGPGELGLFAIFFSLVFLSLAIQESFLLGPYNLKAAGKADGRERRQYLGAVLADAGLLNLVVAALFLVSAAALWAIGWTQPASICVVLMAATPCVLFRELARRVVYADFRPHAALAISAGVGALQLAFMGAFYWADRLTAGASFAAMGASSFVGVGIWLVADRKFIEFGAVDRRTRYVEHWRLGRWLLAGQVSDIVRVQMLPWLLALVSDKNTVGIYAACAFVAALPMPLHVAFSNVLVPQLAHVHKRQGPRHTDQLVFQATRWLTAAMIAYAAPVILLSGHLVSWFYGSEFTGTQHPLIVLVLAWSLAGATLPWARALVVIDRPDQMFYSYLAGIATNMVLGVPMVAAWGAPGAAYAALVSTVVKSSLDGYWYRAEIRRQIAADPHESIVPPTSAGRREHSWTGPTAAALLVTEEAV
jgi:O-antigen/teichoic acid export membrane protein